MRNCWEWEPDDRPSFADIVTQLDNMFNTSSVEQGVSLCFSFCIYIYISLSLLLWDTFLSYAFR